MERKEALTQAYNRALIMNSFFENYFDEYISDYYINERNNSRLDYFADRFAEYHQITSQSYINTACYDTIFIYYTKYNECVIILEFTPLSTDKLKRTDTLISQAVYYHSEDNLNINSDKKIRLKIQSSLNGRNILSYNIIQYNDAVQISVADDKKKNPMGNVPLKYLNLQSGFDDLKNSCSYNLSYGLWSAYLMSVFKCLTNQDINNAKIKSMGDFYTTKTENLIRQIAVIKYSSKIKGLDLENGNLHITLETM